MATNGVVDPETEEALVEWINSFPLEQSIPALKDLGDGHVFWQMLRYIDDEFFNGNLPSDKRSQYVYKQNLQYVYEHIEQCLEYRGRSYKRLHDVDIDQVVEGDQTFYSVKFIRLVLLVMLDSPRLPDLVATVQTLPANTMTIVGALMQEMMEGEEDADFDNVEEAPNQESDAHDGDSHHRSALPDLRAEVLELEEQYAKVVSQLERRNRDYESLESELHAISEGLAKAQEKNDALSSQIVEKDEQLRKQRSVISDREHSSVRELESKISQQEEMIAGNEAQLEKFHTMQAELQRESRKLSNTDEKLQRLQDEYDANKVELERQTRKANTADKYMQKLQAGQSIEKERDALRAELDETREMLKGTDRLRQENAALHKSNDETSRTLSQIEQEHEELRMTKKQLRIAYDGLSQQIDALNERFAQDQETIAELKERSFGPTSPTSPRANGGLEGELLDSSSLENEVKSRLESLEKQNRQLSHEKADREREMTALRRQVESLEATLGDERSQLQKSRQEVIALQTSLTQVQQGHPIEGTEVFKRMRDQVRAAETKKSESEEITNALRQELESLRAEYSLLGKDETVIIEEIKKQKENEFAHVRTELTNAKKQCDTLQAELDKRTEMGELASRKTEHDPSEESQDRLAKQQLEIESKNSMIEDLTAQLQKTTIGDISSASNLKPEDRVYITNLERENRLMSSSFHDLAGRMAHSSTIVTRRAENPLNWLGRQRKAAEGLAGLAR